jgi:hypothetical protein
MVRSRAVGLWVMASELGVQQYGYGYSNRVRDRAVGLGVGLYY